MAKASMAKAPIAAKKTRKTRTPRASLTPRFTQLYEYDGWSDSSEYLSVGYLRQLIAGIPRTVSDNYEVSFGDSTLVFPYAESAPIKSRRGRTAKVAITSGATEEEFDDSDLDEDEDEI